MPQSSSLASWPDCAEKGPGGEGASPFKGLTIWAAMTSSSTTARTRREAFSKGEGTTGSCSLGRFGLLAPHDARARGWRHRRGWPGRLQDERSGAQHSRLSLSLASWSPLYGHQAPRFPSSRHAGRVRSHLESPGKSMGEAAAPGSPWGIPGCSLGWEVGSGGTGSEGQPFPRGSALHGSKQFSVADGAGDLGREKAPPVGRPERPSSHCRRHRRSQRISARHLPPEPGLQRPQLSHGASLPGPLSP